MKILSFIICLFSLAFVHAQEEIVVSMKNKSMSMGEVPAFVVMIPEANYETVVKNWENYLKEKTKEKTTTENGEIVIVNKLYDKISHEPLNIYSYIKEYDKEIMLVAAIQLKGTFISRDMQEEIYLPTKKYIRDFAVNQYKEAVGNELKEEEKAQKKLESKLNNLISTKEYTLATISDMERSVISKKDEITILQIDQSDKIIQVQAQKELVLKLANAGQTDKEEAQKILDELEKEFKKLQKQQEKTYQEIDAIESSIRSKKNEIDTTESEIKLTKLEIDDQKYRVQKVEKKLGNIE